MDAVLETEVAEPDRSGQEPVEDVGAAAAAEGKLWRPRRVVITPDALALPHGRVMLERAASFGAEVVKLKANRLAGLFDGDERKAYALAKTTFAIVVSPAGQRKLQPIPPSADWQFHVAQGCMTVAALLGRFDGVWKALRAHTTGADCAGRRRRRQTRLRGRVRHHRRRGQRLR